MSYINRLESTELRYQDLSGLDFRADAAGLRIVLHVHDEIVVECDAANAAATLDALQAAMLALPAWAASFPIGAEGWTGKRYRK